MTGKTHMVGGIALASGLSLVTGLYAPTSDISSQITWLVFLGGASSGALILDIDKKGSTISNKHKFISFIVRIFCTHRGPTHSILALFLMSLVALGISILFPFGIIKALLIGYILGIGSHLLLDLQNPKGVPLAYPCKKRFHILKIETSSLMELLYFLVLLTITAYIIYMQIHNLPLIRQLLNI